MEAGTESAAPQRCFRPGSDSAGNLGPGHDRHAACLNLRVADRPLRKEPAPGSEVAMDRKSRPLPLLIGVAVASAVALAVVEWPRVRNWYRPPAAGLPAPAQT